MIFVLLLVVGGGGGLSAEFETEAACQSALEQMTEDAGPNPVIGRCVPKGEVQPVREADPTLEPLAEQTAETFRLQIRRCWTVDVGSEAADVTVAIRFDLDRSSRVDSGSLRMVGASGGSTSAQRAAFEWGRRAILRCQVEDGGYDLPPEKYEQWRTQTVVFDPRDMRVR